MRSARATSQHQGWRAVGVSLAALSLVAGCSSGAGGVGAGTNSSSSDFVVGTVQSLSGTFAPLGQDTLHGVQAEAAILNKAGGINGRKVKVISQDDGSDAQRAISAAQQMTRSQHLDAFVPDTVFANEQLPVTTSTLNVSICSQEVCGDGKKYPQAFTMNPPTTVQVPPLIAYAQQQKLGKTVILAQDTSEGHFFAQTVQSDEKKKGLPASPTIFFDPNATDITSQVQQARSGGAGAVYVWATGTGIGVVARGVQNVGWKVPLLGVSAIFTGPVDDLVPAAVQPQVTCLCYAAGIRTKSQSTVSGYVTKLVDALKTVGGVHTLFVATLGADALSAIAYGYEKSNSSDYKKAAESLDKIGSDPNYPGSQFWTFRHVNPAFSGDVHSPLKADFGTGFFAVAHPGKVISGTYPGEPFSY